MKTLTLNVLGMTCEGCVKSVSDVLNELDGVLDMAISLEKAAVIISYHEDKLSQAQLIETIEEAGFDVQR